MCGDETKDELRCAGSLVQLHWSSLFVCALPRYRTDQSIVYTSTQVLVLSYLLYFFDLDLILLFSYFLIVIVLLLPHLSLAPSSPTIPS
jgi:hypothetical protein